MINRPRVVLTLLAALGNVGKPAKRKFTVLA
jgi:hypothetical protein